ncbi:9034_t:CDS:1 [Funneliformis geosporum]|uniref:1836_t:CDS:1 n=1 Tax=Funneliformis geosporum TaxID=1117311 RepID=A0A9W4WSL6_9GLOM|nr:1836_t:CDS:1 [Funneliformis geosporum]CAI2176541.1 9034_t:CDS:1 [Funneliformis geosporum]
MFEEIFKRRIHEMNSLRTRKETKLAYEEECNRLKMLVELLTEQRKESVETIRLVNSGLNDLISSLQKKNPPSDVTPIPNEFISTRAAQLINSIQAELEIDGVLPPDDLEDESHNVMEVVNESSSLKPIKRHDDDGLKTELVILQSQMNRLRTEQDKLSLNIDQHRKQKNGKVHGESSNHAHKRFININLSKESLDDSDSSGMDTERDEDSYTELIKKQEKEINRLRQRIKIYDNQFRDYQTVNGVENMIDTDETKEIKGEFKNLQRLFHKFTSVSGEVDTKEAKSLLELYQLESFQNNSKSSKIHLAAAMEKRLLSTLQEEVKGYFAETEKNSYFGEDYDDDNLELDLVETTEKLVELLNRFANARTNGDKSLKKTCNELRSLIYSSLSTFSFSKSGDGTHPFITSLVSQFIKFMEAYHAYSSTELSQVKEEAKQIILEFISLVYFKLKSLDPQSELIFYKQCSEVDEYKMKGAWNKTDSSNQEVEICYFPAVIKNNATQNILISKAQVLTRPRYKPMTHI